MDKIFDVLLFKKGDVEGKSVYYYLSSVYDVSTLLDNISSDSVVQISVFPITDVTRENVKDLLF